MDLYDNSHDSFTITDQADIDDGPSGRNATGTLTFSNLTSAGMVVVRESASLEILEFPNLNSLYSLQISQVTSVTTVSLPSLGPPGGCSDISTNDFLGFEDLISASSLDFRDGYQFLPNLTSVGSISLKNDTLVLAMSPLHIKDTMTVTLSPYSRGNVFSRVDRIGGDLNITSNSYAYFTYDGLQEVGGRLIIRNNTNCTFDFSAVANMGRLFFTDNGNIQVPQFTSLEMPQTIYISGIIDTYVNNSWILNRPNIFPALKYVLGNVTIEALNNVTDTPTLSDNEASTPVSPTPDKSLSQRAQAGIGVGTNIFAIGIIGVLIRFIIHFRNRLRTLESEKTKGSDDNGSSTEPEQPHILHMSEVCGHGIFRENPDDPLVEMPTQPAELPTGPYSWDGTEGEVGLAM
ncbi:hypothetical protein GGS24DRAFT_488914 [Hypoxylon argillaceum]|nr:hypothetical protein GGS24DRAFT_488914 [Hypoxylon argillaceum]